MPNVSPAEKVHMAHDLRTTVRELRDRGLVVAAKW
jgi:anaphase-promoting complex subunit 8